MPRIKEDYIHTIEIKKSKFITYLHRTESEEDAKEFLKRIKKEHPGATHHCTAMVIGNLMRSNDDGEPAQTAGHPMLDVLLHNHMDCILVVVVRYFGGIKLGTGGLVRAYSSSVSEALKNAVLCETTTFHEYEIQFPYDLIGKMDSYFRKQGIEITLQDYQTNVIYHYLTLNDITKDLQEISGGTIHPVFLQDQISEKII